jgi:hypothetical protein
MSTKNWHIALLLIAALFGCAVNGCKSKSRFQFDRLDMLPPEEELKEFPLGEYKIPIPIVEDRAQNKVTRRNRFQFQFALFAVVSPQDKSQIEDAWELHEGQIRDKVMNVCRSATVDELQEPELATLKARLTDVLASQLGEKPLRQLVINQIVSQEL